MELTGLLKGLAGNDAVGAALKELSANGNR
jgi:hypothetical protein